MPDKTALAANGVTPLLDTEDVAAWLQTTPGAIRATRFRDEAPGNLGFPVGRRLKFDAEDIRAFIATRKDGGSR